jgi:maltose/moltooligosaccharide transporter
VPWTQRLAYLGCSLSIGVFSAFNNFTLSLWLSGFTTSYVLISLLGNTRSVEGLVVSPLAGLWSDRVWLGWLGRRRPFILVGGLTSALLLALTPTIARAPLPLGGQLLPPEVGRLAPIVLAVFLFTFTFNVMDDIHKALLADLTDGPEQNWLSGLSVAVNIGSNVLLLVLGSLLWRDEVPDSAFLLTGVLVAGGVLWTVAGLREPAPAVWSSGGGREDDDARLRPLELIQRYRGALIFCLVTFFYWSGVNAVLPLISIYTRDILGASVGEAQLLPGLLMLSTSLLALPVGALGSHFGKRRVLAAGYAIMGVSALFGLVITTRLEGAALYLFAGLGNAAAIVLAIPLLADLVPRQQMGVAAGLLAASGSLAAPLSSLIAGELAGQFGPRAIFGVMAVSTAVAVALMPLIGPDLDQVGAPVPGPRLPAPLPGGGPG